MQPRRQLQEKRHFGIAEFQTTFVVPVISDVGVRQHHARAGVSSFERFVTPRNPDTAR